MKELLLSAGERNGKLAFAVGKAPTGWALATLRIEGGNVRATVYDESGNIYRSFRIVDGQLQMPSPSAYELGAMNTRGTSLLLFAAIVGFLLFLYSTPGVFESTRNAIDQKQLDYQDRFTRVAKDCRLYGTPSNNDLGFTSATEINEYINQRSTLEIIKQLPNTDNTTMFWYNVMLSRVVSPLWNLLGMNPFLQIVKDKNKDIQNFSFHKNNPDELCRRSWEELEKYAEGDVKTVSNFWGILLAILGSSAFSQLQGLWGRLTGTAQAPPALQGSGPLPLPGPAGEDAKVPILESVNLDNWIYNENKNDYITNEYERLKMRSVAELKQMAGNPIVKRPSFKENYIRIILANTYN